MDLIYTYIYIYDYDEISIMPRYGLLVYIFIMNILNCLWIISQNNIRRMSLSWWCHYVAYWYKIYDDIVWWLYMMMRCHKDTGWLRSTTSSYGWTFDRGRIWGDYDSLHRSCLRDINLGKVVGVLSWYITHVRHTGVDTSVGTVYDIF